jgi:DNA-binding MarR family transcriptional regulator
LAAKSLWHARAEQNPEESLPMTTTPRAAANASASAPAEPPKRRAGHPADIAGHEASVNRYLAAYIMGVANRLANGASNHYRTHYGLGMSEWRAMMALGARKESMVREVAEMADLDQAAASKSVRLLEARGLVTVEQTQRRGRAAIVRLTPVGVETHKSMRAAAGRRQKRLVSAFTDEEIETLWSLLRRVEAQVPIMNAD